MRKPVGTHLAAFWDGANTLVGWTVLVVATQILSFCLGYWIGHGQICGPWKTFVAYTWIPILWLTFAQMFLAYAAMALAWYIPICYPSTWFRWPLLVLHCGTWVWVIASIVEQSAHGKFWRY